MYVIYLIRNRINKKIYVGQSQTSLAHRWAKHVWSAKSGSSIYLHRAIRKYGPGAFDVKVLISGITNKKELDRLECLWIEKLGSFDTHVGYNLTAGGDGPNGHKHSEESKKKMREAAKRRSCSEVQLRALREHHSEAIAKSAAMRLGKPSGRKGKECTAAAVAVARVFNLGTKHTEEHKRKIGLAGLGRKMSPETRLRMSSAAKLRESIKRAARISTLGVIALLAWALPSHAQSVSVQGNLRDLGLNEATTTASYVQFTLQNYGATTPRVIGTNVIVQPVRPPFYPDANGNISGNIQANDSITPAGTFYSVCVFYQGSLAFPCQNYLIPSSPGTFNLNSATPITVTPPPYVAQYILANPQGPQAIATFGLSVTSLGLGVYTAATLPVPTSVPVGSLASITDGITSGSCQGGGSGLSLCWNTGSAWESIGGGGGGVSWPLTSTTANPATSGQIRLAQTDCIDWRNQPNSGNLSLCVNNSNQVTFNGQLLCVNGSCQTAETFSVLDYGVTGDGMTDDSPNTQLAINACAAGANSGVLLFPPSPVSGGFYFLNSALSWPTATASCIPVIQDKLEVCAQSWQAGNYINWGLPTSGNPYGMAAVAYQLNVTGLPGMFNSDCPTPTTFPLIQLGDGTGQSGNIYMGGLNLEAANGYPVLQINSAFATTGMLNNNIVLEDNIMQGGSDADESHPIVIGRDITGLTVNRGSYGCDGCGVAFDLGGSNTGPSANNIAGATNLMFNGICFGEGIYDEILIHSDGALGGPNGQVTLNNVNTLCGNQGYTGGGQSTAPIITIDTSNVPFYGLQCYNSVDYTSAAAFLVWSAGTTGQLNNIYMNQCFASENPLNQSPNRVLLPYISVPAGQLVTPPATIIAPSGHFANGLVVDSGETDLQNTVVTGTETISSTLIVSGIISASAGVQFAEITAPSGVSSTDIFYGLSSIHWPAFNPNNGTPRSVCGSTGTFTSGHIVASNSNGTLCDLVDGGTGTGSGTVTGVNMEDITTGTQNLATCATANPGTTPDITCTLANAPADKVFGNCTASPGAPDFVALTEACLPGATVFTDAAATFGAHAYNFSAATVTLPGVFVRTDTANTFGAHLNNFSSSTLELPTGAGFTTGATSAIGIDSSTGYFHGYQNGNDRLFVIGTNIGTLGQVCTSNANGTCTFNTAASGVTIQTNTVNNSSQTTLNFVSGPDVTMTNTSGGIVTPTIPSQAGGGLSFLRCTDTGGAAGQYFGITGGGICGNLTPGVVPDHGQICSGYTVVQANLGQPIFCTDAGSAAVTLNAPSTYTTNFFFCLMAQGAGTVTVTASGNVNGAGTLAIATTRHACFSNNGTTWDALTGLGF